MSPRLHEHVQALFIRREADLRVWGKRIAYAVAGISAAVLILALSYAFIFGPVGTLEARPEFVIAPEESLVDVAKRLEDEGLVKFAAAFRFSYGLMRSDRVLRPGGYVISPGMNTLEIAKKLSEVPYLAWVSFPEGRRKEEIADILTATLGWGREQREEWLLATASMPDITEGVFYPDIYLIPSDQPAAQIAARMRGRFEDAVAPYAVEALKKNKEWKEVLILASLIEREAAKNDKALVAGILQNRLKKGMLLQVDATLQYLRGEEGNWWPTPNADDKYTESPYNTYLNEGLPPEPIATPSLASIEAALNPEYTSCLYYLHDRYGRIHCATNYTAHKANVQRYLR